MEIVETGAFLSYFDCWELAAFSILALSRLLSVCRSTIFRLRTGTKHPLSLLISYEQLVAVLLSHMASMSYATDTKLWDQA